MWSDVWKLVRASHRCREVAGSNPVEVLTFSGFYIRKDKYPSIFSQPNWGYCVYYPSVLKIGEYPRIFPSFSWGISAHVTRLDQSRASENIWWIIRASILQPYDLGQTHRRRQRSIQVFFEFFKFWIWPNHNSLLSIATNQFASFCMDIRWRQFFVLTTFWRPLWSNTEQTHGKMESIC